MCLTLCACRFAVGENFFHLPNLARKRKTDRTAHENSFLSSSGS
jgi:hypothetical protein